MCANVSVASGSWNAGGYTPGLACRDVPRDWPDQDMSRHVQSGGTWWHVQQSGQGPALLLLHGTAASTHTWRDIRPLLTKHFNVLAIDLPGHGYTQRLAGGSMSLPDVAAGVADLLDTLEFRPRYLVGHSAGAAIALRMAMDGRVDPACIVGLNAALLPFAGAMQRLFGNMAQLFATTRLMPKVIARRARDVNAVRRVLRGTGSEVDAASVDCYQRLLQNEGHVAAVLSMMANWDLQPLLADLPGLEPRLHLVAGEQDKAVSPREADRVAAALSGVTVTRLDNCGHLAHEEQPSRVAELIEAFCTHTEHADNDRD